MQELMTFSISQICVTQPVVPEYSVCIAQLFKKMFQNAQNNEFRITQYQEKFPR